MNVQQSVSGESALRDLLQRGGHAFRLRGPLANRPEAKLLHFLLVGFGASLIIEFFVGLPFWPNKLVFAVPAFFMGLFAATALVLLYRGSIRAARWVYVSGIWLITTRIVIMSASLRSPGTVFYIALSIAAAWLVGHWAVLVFGGIGLGTLLLMAHSDLTGLLSANGLAGLALPMWGDLVIAIVIATVSIARVLALVREALARSQADKAALRDTVKQLEREVAERKRTEQALRESEEHFRAIFQQAGVGVAQVSLGGRVELANDRYCEVVGHSRADLMDKGTVEITHVEDLQQQLRMMPRLLAGEIPSFSTEKRYTRNDGTVIWAAMWKSLVRDANGRPKCFIAVVEDITERKQVEVALRESESRFRNMANNATVMIVASGPDRQATFFNKSWLDFTGRTEVEELGEGWTLGVHPDDRERVYAGLSASYDARSACRLEYRLRRADGEYRWVLCNGVPRLEGGVFSGYIGSAIDITDLRSAQEAAITRQKLEGLGVLAGGVAHDFNNLLGGVLASAELLLEERAEGLAPDEEELLRIRTAAIRGGEIVRQLMIYSGEPCQSFELVDISRLVGEMLELLKVSISKRATLKLDLPENLCAVLANAPQMRQVIINLITNASEAIGEEQGVIGVTVAEQFSIPDSNGDEPVRKHLRLEVSDSGCGMTKEIQAKIFDPFFTTKFAGRGLGLAAVQGIIRSHGGTIQVTSAPGQGSRFCILLPCGSQSTPANVDGQASSTIGQVRSLTGTVLLVEDEETLRLAVSKMLTRSGVTVIEAANGKSAADLFRAHAREIEAVLLDLTLPNMSGKEVLEELRRIRPDIKVIVMSAYSQDYVLGTIGGVQTWLYLRKPYHFTELTTLLSNLGLATRE